MTEFDRALCRYFDGKRDTRLLSQLWGSSLKFTHILTYIYTYTHICIYIYTYVGAIIAANRRDHRKYSCKGLRINIVDVLDPKVCIFSILGHCWHIQKPTATRLFIAVFWREWDSRHKPNQSFTSLIPKLPSSRFCAIGLAALNVCGGSGALRVGGFITQAQNSGLEARSRKC